MLVIVGMFLLTELSFGALPEYEIIDLGTLGGSFSYPLGINDAGQVVGTSRTADGVVGHGFLWDDVNGMMDLAELLDESSQWGGINSAIEINNNGQILGRFPLGGPIGVGDPIGGTDSYFIWDNETGFIELLAFKGLGIKHIGDTIRAMNDNMQVVGTTLAQGPSDPPDISLDWHALLWDSINGVTDLGTLGGSDSSAYNINESGIVVGASTTGILYENDRDEVHAFLWDSDNGMVDLGTLSNNDSSAWAINNFDKVIGASVVEIPDENKSSTISHAFVWTGTDGMIDIHDSSYAGSIALGINDADQVVGIVSNNMYIDHLRGVIMFGFGINFPSPSYCFPFLWDKRYGMINLNDMLDEGLGWDYLESAKGINNEGQIIGLGSINGQKHAFLLNPIPPIPAETDIEPKTLNLSSNGKWISCRIWLSEDYDVADVNTNSILLEGQIAPAQVWVNEEEQVVMTKFSRAEVQDIIEAGEVELIVSGELIDGAKFEGTDTIRVIDKGSRGK
jgi:probable HAF family extracellular repeat protein